MDFRTREVTFYFVPASGTPAGYLNAWGTTRFGVGISKAECHLLGFRVSSVRGDHAVKTFGAFCQVTRFLPDGTVDLQASVSFADNSPADDLFHGMLKALVVVITDEPGRPKTFEKQSLLNSRVGVQVNRVPWCVSSDTVTPPEHYTSPQFQFSIPITRHIPILNGFHFQKLGGGDQYLKELGIQVSTMAGGLNQIGMSVAAQVSDNNEYGNGWDVFQEGASILGVSDGMPGGQVLDFQPAPIELNFALNGTRSSRFGTTQVNFPTPVQPGLILIGIKAFGFDRTHDAHFNLLTLNTTSIIGHDPSTVVVSASGFMGNQESHTVGVQLVVYAVRQA